MCSDVEATSARREQVITVWVAWPDTYHGCFRLDRDMLQEAGIAGILDDGTVVDGIVTEVNSYYEALDDAVKCFLWHGSVCKDPEHFCEGRASDIEMFLTERDFEDHHGHDCDYH